MVYRAGHGNIREGLVQKHEPQGLVGSMPSQSYREWLSTRAKALDEIEAAHASVGGTGPGRRYATQQINQAYAVLVASQFQGFCRDLHTESVARLMAFIDPPELVLHLVQARFTEAASSIARTLSLAASDQISASWASSSGMRLINITRKAKTEKENLKI